MKFKKDALLGILDMIRPALAKREMTEQATHFGFSGQDVVAFNDNVCIVHPLDTDFKCSVPADQFYKILEKMPGEELEIEMADDGKLEIWSGRTRSGILVQDGKALLSRVDAVGIDKIDKFRKMPSEFLAAITLCAFSTSTDASKPNITGVLVRSNSALSTDGLRISEYLMDGEFNKSFNIPAASVRELIKFPVTHYHISDNWAYFATKDDVVFCTKLLEVEKYPNVTRYFKLQGIEFELPDMFRQSVETAMIMVDAKTEEEKLIEVEIDTDHVRCRGSNDIAWIENEIEGKVDIAKLIRFNINPGHLLKIMEQTRKLVYGEERALFRSNNFQHLICLVPANDAPAEPQTKKKGKKKKDNKEE